MTSSASGTSGAATDVMKASPKTDGGRHKPAAIGTWRRAETLAAILLIAPALLLFAVTVLYPLEETIRLSFFDIRGLSTPRFTGLGNYIKLFADPIFLNTLSTTLIWTLSTTALSVGLGWALAIMCGIAPRQTLIFRFMIFAAFGISDAVAGFMWLNIFRPDDAGLLNSVLRAIALGNMQHSWLGDTSTALWALVATAVWSGVGLPLIICFASVQAIPANLVEAALVDGAKPMDIMRHILMPLSLPGARVALFINLLGSLRAFDIIYVLTQGGPVRSTETVGFFMYRESFTQFKLGYGAAATIVLLVAVLFVSIPAIMQRTAMAR
jgi:raffinose/stachyose/melibiose transport system permease protein